MTHTCHALGCETPCKPEFLMCLKHWRMVPLKLQQRVWATYRHGQCDDKSPSEQWHEAADAAIAAVALRAGHPPGKLTVPMVRAVLALAPELLGEDLEKIRLQLKKAVHP
jgi:hypothetical protein